MTSRVTGFGVMANITYLFAVSRDNYLSGRADSADGMLPKCFDWKTYKAE